ncbi:bifunctional glycosyltransferase/CDP-glycerol:glycerophosphate glycerophosphotransferase [Streptomyces fractus]|uniref:bifunctional glycosyltransferase/CDP-glycerol:glycerophosphate glycerophosphotransferase n=1 Tax=Streptomyces fractus TaxID=641806 RepID=UPI003CF82657
MSTRLSVIVPIYDVEEYLPACLDSLAGQSMKDLEVVMVDDGSPDGSAAIAAEYAARDGRFRLVRKENAGLGAARNTGLGHVSPSSEYIAFVDSDDVVPPDAYRTMVGSLDESGSDFATGNVHHLRGEKTWQAGQMRMLSGEARRRVHIADDPRLIADRIACNKVYRRAFWDRCGFSFPEGVLYEDTPVVLPAYYRAEAVDIVGEPVYYWRLRESWAAPSITQRRTEPQSVRDRIAGVLAVSAFLAALPDPRAEAFKREYDGRALRDDLRIFLRVLPDGDAAYREAFLSEANRFLDQIDPKLVLELPTELRVQWILVRKHAMDELLDLLASRQRWDRVPITGLRRKYAEFTPLTERGFVLPKQALRIDKELSLRSPLRAAEWKGGKLVLEGDAWISRIDLPGRRSSVKAIQLKRDGSRRRTLLPAANVHHPQATTDSGQKSHNYDWAGWRVEIDPERFRRRGVWQEGLWHVGIHVYAGGLFRRSAVWTRGAATANYPPVHWVDADHRLVPHSVRGALKVRVERVRALITDRRFVGDVLRVSGELRTELRPDERMSLRLTNRATGDRMDYPAVVDGSSRGSALAVTVPLAEVALLVSPDGSATRPGKSRWSTEWVATDAQSTQRRFSTVVREGLADLATDLFEQFGAVGEGAEIAVTSGANGYLKITSRARRAVIDRIGELDGKIVLSGRASLADIGRKLVLSASSRADERRGAVDWRPDGCFTASFDPSVMGGSGGGLPLRAGRWNLLLVGEGDQPRTPFVIDRLALPQFPLHSELKGRRYWLENRWEDFPQLNCRSELGDDERGPYRQLQLRNNLYAPMRENEPLRDQVCYFSYNGKQCSDSPRAMHEELVRRGADLRHLWVVRDGQVELPDGLEKVRMWGSEWFEALATSRYIITNGHLPDWFQRRPGQVVVQTWHGTMLKQIGHDIATPRFDREYHNRLAREVGNWSLLVSANRFSTPILRRAFSYQGEILESGYPRNDRLHAPDRDRTAARVRRELGLPDGKRVVLYAPTWRDDSAHKAGQFKFDLRIDLAEARERLGEDHALLIRRHSNIVDVVPQAGDGFVWDVSEYPDIADLYLVADVLITDYSSVMFDYAHLERPMLFFTYDLDHYRDTLRGFYFDFEADSPGPLLRTSEELIEAIRDIEKVHIAHQDRFARFQHLFCDLDDGKAAARVVDRMLEQAEEV